MIDIKFLRENPDVVKQNIKNKFQDSKLPLVDEVIELDAQARATQQEADDLRANRNKLSKQIGALMAQGKKEEAEEIKKQVTEQAERLSELQENETELQAKVKEIICDKLSVDEAEVTNEASFANDLGADSLDTVELIMEFEKQFKITIPDDQAEKISTVGDAISYIEEHIK